VIVLTDVGTSRAEDRRMNTTAAHLTTPVPVTGRGGDAVVVEPSTSPAVPDSVRRPASIVRRLARRVRGIGGGSASHDAAVARAQQTRVDLQTRFHVH
jgi:hypothetical protein